MNSEGLYVEAAAVESQPLADQRDVSLRVLRLIGQVYKARRICGAGGYGGVCAHIFVGYALFVPDLALQAEFGGKLLRFGRKYLGVDYAARLVRYVARPALRLSEYAPLFERLFAAVEDRHSLDWGESVLFVARQIFVETVRGEGAALSRSARTIRVACFRHRYRKFCASARGCGARRREGRGADALRRNFILGAESRYDGEAHRLSSDRHDEQLARLAAEIFVYYDAAAKVAHFAAERVEQNRLRLAFSSEQSYHRKCLGVEIFILDFDVHLYFLPK